MGTRYTLLRPGLVDYARAWDLQRDIAASVRSGGDETLILLEHPATYTLGARGATNYLLASEAALAALGAAVIRSDRGGDVTFHGPGQIVGYPIINLRARGQGPVWHVRSLERVLIEALARFGIDGGRAEGRPGVWCGNDKIAAIGVRVSGGVTTHGFALNVNTDLSYFSHIVPCGLAGAGVTSMQRIIGSTTPIERVSDAIVESFERAFGFAPVGFAPAEAALAEVAVGR